MTVSSTQSINDRLRLKEETISTPSEQQDHPEQNPVTQSQSPAKPSAVSDRTVKELVKIFKLLSDETRLRILLFLVKEKELHVRALCDHLGQSQPAVSHHLALLRVAGLIERRREGKHNFYHIMPESFQGLLDMLFESIPEAEGQIKFEDHILKYSGDEGRL